MSQALFLEKLECVQTWLADKNIEHRIIGSLATECFVESPGGLDFDRPGDAPHQRIPDVDLLVPRADVPAIAEAKTFFLNDVGIKVGFSVSEHIFDLRPDEGESFLTFSDGRSQPIDRPPLPVETSLFEPHRASLLGVPITTLDPSTLFHTYVTIGNRLRVRDTPRLIALGRHIMSSGESRFGEKHFGAFHQFIAERKQLTRGTWEAGWRERP